MRIGHSVDVHKLEPKEDFILGGVKIEHYKGIVGHSDADCLLHSVAESLLGALALGDLGSLFPDTNDAFKNQNSSYFVEKAFEKVKEKGYKVSNIDCMICLETPKIRRYIDSMRKNIAALLNVHISQVSIKATTYEGVGPIGTEQAIETHSTVLLRKAGVKFL
ncbi:MAG: 2-C-methyl-D-erythritol 2,4-cyclodiphosphate synthase [Candidatus Izimaplasma sp.]|nr:2-C-methyl-D-erythritol 2,4-cyclodiphosphate synthase [Candidatus Izimaplasma bacterium]